MNSTSIWYAVFLGVAALVVAAFLAYRHVFLPRQVAPPVSVLRPVCSTFLDFRPPKKARTYPLVNKHRPWQIGVGRLVSIKTRLFSGSMLIYQRVDLGVFQERNHEKACLIFQGQKSATKAHYAASSCVASDGAVVECFEPFGSEFIQSIRWI